MLDYKVSPKAEKFFKKIKDKNLKDKFKNAIVEIRKNPDIGEKKRYDLKGLYGLNLYYDGTNYEIAYQLVELKNKIIIIILAGTRENFYDELKSYMAEYKKYFKVAGK